MPGSDSTPEFSRISTNWELLFQAHRGQGGEAFEAQRLLLQRYCGAVYHYLLTNVHDRDAAEELSQEFALRFVRGDFWRADPRRGRFRDYVKASLYRMVIDHHRARRSRPLPLPEGSPPAAAQEPADDQAEKEFVSHWRRQLLNCAWEELARVQAETGQPYHRLLNWRVEDPGVSAARLAERLGQELGRPFTEVGIRQLLYRARTRFAELLIAEVARSLQTSETAAVEQELADLELLAYCRPALQRRPEQP
jgi:RNA polymerase sigma-70 factor (ECF subfamily)